MLVFIRKLSFQMNAVSYQKSAFSIMEAGPARE